MHILAKTFEIYFLAKISIITGFPCLISFVLFLLSAITFPRARDKTRDCQLSGYWLSTTAQVDLHRFIKPFPYGRTVENPVNGSFEKTILYWRGLLLAKITMIPVSPGFWHHPLLTFLLLSISICRSKKPAFRVRSVHLRWTKIMNVRCCHAVRVMSGRRKTCQGRVRASKVVSGPETWKRCWP